MTSSPRTLAVFATGALLAPLVSFSTPAFAAGEATPPAPRSVADLCANVPASYDPFSDDNGNTFEQNIECLAFAEITTGQSGGNTYGPGGVVRRDQMASFIARLIDKADELDTGETIAMLPAFDGTVDFSDVASGNVHRQAIDRLAEAGIVSGGPGGRPASQYGPELEVTRAQMASFIRNALEFMTGEDIVSSNDYFTDDEMASPHQPRINAVAELGIAVGDGRDAYNPFASVTRGQMSGFLTRTLAVLEADGAITPVGEDDGEEPTFDEIVVTPDAAVELEAVENPDTDTSDDRTYNATGLVEDVEYRVSLVRSENYDREAGTFKASADERSESGFSVDTGAPTADVTRVNGTATTDSDTTAAGLQAGSVTFVATGETTSFVVDGDQAGEDVFPVLYRNGGEGRTPQEGGTSPRLEVEGGPAGEFSPSTERFDDGGDITFTGAGADDPVTELPELVSVELVESREEPGTPLPGDENTVSDVRFTFDEPVTGETAPDAALFHLVGFDSDTRFDGSEAVVEDDESSALVTFGAASSVTTPGGETVGEEELAEVSLATVDAGAVTDVGGDANPIGDAPFGESRVDETGAGGVTAAPDLISVGGFTSTAGQNTTQVTFTFDQAAFTLEPEGFHLVTTDNQDITCTAVDGAEGGQDAEADETVAADCPEELVGSDIAAADIARGYVDTATVASEEQDSLPGDDGTLNAEQASQQPDGNSTGPDLESATFDVETDQVTYTFDAPVRIANDTDTDAGGADTDADGADGQGDFRVYDAAGNETTATAVTRSGTTSDQVVATFADGTLEGAIGAITADSAVEGATTAATGTNRPDEVGVDNIESSELTAGATDGPDLVSVSIETATGTARTATFTFDEAVAVDVGTDAAAGNVVEEGFSLYLADGTRLECTASDNTAGDANSVTCTAFTVDVTDGGAATSAQIAEAVLGTVDDGSVSDTEDEPSTNPEGAEATTGGTGTPSN